MLHEEQPYACGADTTRRCTSITWCETRDRPDRRRAHPRGLAPSLLEIDSRTLRLGAGVRVDLRDAERLARAELDGGDSDFVALGADLLPDWYDDWVLIERERFRQLRMRALEAACRRLTEEERLDEALEAGLMAVGAEPLRESAHRMLVLLHLAAGNAVEARRQYQLCRDLLRSQLGLEPSERMRELVSGLDVEGTIR